MSEVGVITRWCEAEMTNIAVETEERKKSLRTPNDVWKTIASFSVLEGKVVEIYADILAQRNDKTARASFTLEGLFYRNTGNLLAQDGTTSKLNVGSLAVDVNIVVNTADINNQIIEIQVQGQAGTVIFWECSARVRTREQVEDYTGNPRLQVSIIGMAESKKLGWMGLTDGINYVMMPSAYGCVKNTVPPTLRTYEIWNRYQLKLLGTYYCQDRFTLHASRRGNTTTWSTEESYVLFDWFTCTGDSGTGAVTWVHNIYSAVTGFNGYLKGRVLARSVSALGVSFLWSRLDALGWGNYPR
jgi:hypothetical protein